MRDEVDGASAAGGGHQGTGGEGGAAVPAIAGDAEGEEVAAGGADLFSVDDGEFGGIGGGNFSVGKGEVVVGDGEEGEVGILGGGDDLRETPASAGGVGVDVDDADAFAMGGSSSEAGQASQKAIEPDQEHERYNGNGHVARGAAKNFPGVGNRPGCSGISRFWGRSFRLYRYALQRGTQVRRV
jgi:hypothetical protein